MFVYNDHHFSHRNSTAEYVPPRMIYVSDLMKIALI